MLDKDIDSNIEVEENESAIDLDVANSDDRADTSNAVHESLINITNRGERVMKALRALTINFFDDKFFFVNFFDRLRFLVEVSI